jgi:uncharacterized protein (TIRG00374 family)
MMRHWVLRFLKFAVVAGIFFFLYKTGRINPANLAEIAVRPEMFIASIILMLASILVSVQRWRVLLNIQDFSIDAVTALKLTLVGFFFSTAMPGAVSGDIIKAYYLAKGQEQKTKLISTVVIDRLMGLYTIILSAAMAIVAAILSGYLSGRQTLWSSPSLKIVVLFIGVLFCLLNLAGILFTSKILKGSRVAQRILELMPFHEKVLGIYNAFYQYGQKPKLASGALLLSIVSQIFMFAGMWCLVLLLKIETIGTLNFLLAISVGLLFNAVPLAPGGLGVGEMGFQGIFLLFGSSKGAELALLFHVTIFILAIGVGGPTYLFSNISRVKEPNSLRQ